MIDPVSLAISYMASRFDLPEAFPMTYAEHDLQAFRDRIYVTTGARLTLTDAAVELDRIRGVYRAPLARMADPYFDPTLSEEYALSA